MKQSTNLELNEPIVKWNECEMLTHSQQQSQAPKTHKKESTVRLTTRITMLWAPQRSLLYRLKDSIEAKCKTHSAINKLNSKEYETVNLREKASKGHYQGSCCRFQNVPNTALTIVCTINVSIDCNGFDIPNLPPKKNILK